MELFGPIRKHFWDKPTKGDSSGPRPCPFPEAVRPAAQAQLRWDPTPKTRAEAPPYELWPRPARELGGGPAARHQQSILSGGGCTLAGNRHVSGADRRRRLAAAAAREGGWRRPRRGFTEWSTLRAGAPLARNAARVFPRTRSAWPSWCRCGGAGPEAQGDAASAAVRARGGPPHSPCSSA